MKRLLASIALAATLALPAYAHDDAAQKAPPSEVMTLYDIATAPNPDRIYSDIETLAGFGTRHTLSDTQSDTRGIGAARRWIKAEFETISAQCGGCLEVFYVSGFVEGETRIPERTEVVSVIAIQRGTLDPNRMVMMSGDIDSRVTDPLDGTSDSPGANDNASGMAGVLEAARVLSKYKFAGSIVYAGLSGEEQGLFGGKIVAAHALDQGWEIKGVLNNDMISNISGIDGVVNNSVVRVFSEGTRDTETPEEARARRFTGGEVDSPSRNLSRYVKYLGDQYMVNLDIMMVYRLDRFARGGHHRPFNAVGIPGIRIMETHEHYDRQHQDLRVEDGRVYGDTLDGVDKVYAAKLTGLNAITLAGMAGAPPFPENVEASGAVTASATLKWDRPSGTRAGNLMGYRVHWRATTAPEWTNSRYVGNVDEWTFENLVIDNYYFGVSAVAPDGSETPVVFPGAAGRF
ncbi:M28 family metallopeptidase [Robiginitomaculum antarcticum]|uniref:M28 family metallopeptidase n=1 Tax=Robiginitomaculum antarcticum TaxID=437507 RepID=UPI000371B115|nr:M28 family metallopeptidase [Robiginitomaculum antarcticum]